MSIKDIMNHVGEGLGLKRRAKLGPLGEAVNMLNLLIEKAKHEGKYLESPTVKAIHIVLDHCRLSREALQAAAYLITCVEKGVPAVEIAGAIEDFKKKAVLARLQQAVPFDKLADFHARKPEIQS
jgi:hypothetical protein